MREDSSPFNPAGHSVVDVVRRRRWLQRALSVASLALALAAVGLLGYPFATNLFQAQVQRDLRREFAGPGKVEDYRGRRVAEGDALTRMRIPAIDVNAVVVEGISQSALRAGAGHFPETPLPCEQGNVAVAGHRTTYGRPFHHLDRLAPGDEIILDTPIGTCTYTVSRSFVTAPTNLSVLDPTSAHTLTLVTCHPKNSARKRLIVVATRTAPVTFDEGAEPDRTPARQVSDALPAPR